MAALVHANPQRVQLVRRETTTNALVTAVLAALISWLLFRGRTGIPAIGGGTDGIFGIIPGTFNFTLLVTLVLTLVTRGRVRRGAPNRLPAQGLLARALPDNVLLRSLMLAFLLTLTLVSLTYAAGLTAIRTGVLPPTWSFAGLLLFYVVYFVALALIVTPIVIWRALSD